MNSHVDKWAYEHDFLFLGFLYNERSSDHTAVALEAVLT